MRYPNSGRGRVISKVLVLVSLFSILGRAQNQVITGSAGKSDKPFTVANGHSETSSMPAASEVSTQLIRDNFHGQNYAYVSSQWTGCGYDRGNYSKLMTVQDQAGGSGYYSQDCALYTGYGAFPNDQYATATVVGLPLASQQTAIELRGNVVGSTNESYIACGWNAHDFPADYHYRIWSLAPGGTPVSLWLSKLMPATGDVVWCQVSGTSVTMKVNGVKLRTVIDSSNLRTGYPGLYYMDSNGGPPARRDVMFGNFAAGSITAH